MHRWFSLKKKKKKKRKNKNQSARQLFEQSASDLCYYRSVGNRKIHVDYLSNRKLVISEKLVKNSSLIRRRFYRIDAKR